VPEVDLAAEVDLVHQLELLDLVPQVKEVTEALGAHRGHIMVAGAEALGKQETLVAMPMVETELHQQLQDLV
jgi:hypothetical protein